MGNLLLAIIAAALAQSAPLPAQDGGHDEIVVEGLRKHFKLSARALRAAQSAFDDDRAKYAPQATLTFYVERRGNAPDQGPIKLSLTDGRTRIPIQVAADNGFILPAMPTGDWWIEANRAPRQIRISPLVLSPHFTRSEYRLGDARLQCRVIWAMDKASVSILAAP